MEPAKAEIDRATESAAYQWQARRDRGLTAEESRQFELWLAADPKNPDAIARIGAVWDQMDQLRRLSSPTDRTADADLLARRPTPYHWRHTAALAAAVLVLGLIIGWPRLHPLPEAAKVAVIPAMGRRISLPDGSSAQLAPDGHLEVLFSPAERHVRLTAGRATFAVAKNPSRPFVLSVRNIEIRDIGTVFEVRIDPDNVRVSVSEGEVRAEQVAGETVLLPAGQSAVFPAAATAARNGLLVFSAEPLSGVATEFNRHNRRRLVIGDPATGNLRVGGSFQAQNLNGFLRLLQSTLQVTAEPRADGAIVLRKSD